MWIYCQLDHEDELQWNLNQTKKILFVKLLLCAWLISQWCEATIWRIMTERLPAQTCDDTVSASASGGSMPLAQQNKTKQKTKQNKNKIKQKTKTKNQNNQWPICSWMLSMHQPVTNLNIISRHDPKKWFGSILQQMSIHHNVDPWNRIATYSTDKTGIPGRQNDWHIYTPMWL